MGHLLPRLLKANNRAKKSYLLLGVVGLIAGVEALKSEPLCAQAIAPAADGTGTNVIINGTRYDITGGRTSQDGANLFHSFQRFGLSEGQIANFLSNPNIRNILGRVTGGEASYINGLIQVSGGNSNLFLMNPAGIIFGPNAQLNVPASFAATTATGIGFGRNWFSAIGNNNWAALVGTPSEFAFGASQPGIIANFGNLAVTGGNNLTLLGGSVQNYGTLSSPGGKITLAAVPESNLVRISQEGHLLSLEIGHGAYGMGDGGAIAPQSLPAMLTGGNVSHANSIVTNPDGTIQLTASSGYLLNQGQISATGATGGEINLMGHLTYNLGEISADGSAGGRIRIDTRNLLDAGKISAIAAADNGGEITLNYSGTVIQTASATTNASGAKQGGSILFNGGAGSVLTTSGRFSATGEKGGSIRLFGQDLRLLAASANASGTYGGGEILIGGDFQGQTLGAINAQNTFVNPASTLSADAITSGSGGRIIVWSDKQTTFAGSISARGGTIGGNGGFVEVSGKDTLFMSGSVDVTAASGMPGTLLLDPKNIVIDDTTGTFPSFELTDPNPNGTGFGTSIVPLSTGNVAVTDPNDNFAETNAGAVYLFNGATGALISTLTGTTANDNVGSGGVTALSNGNYVVSSPNWNNGAVTAVGAVTWGNGSTGITGAVSVANSLVGTTANDNVGNYGVTALSNGNYVVSSSNWNNGAATQAGAVTWGNGTTGITGAVSAANSLVGTTAYDNVGNYGVTALSNGNYVVSSPNWDNGAVTDAGAVTWGNGSTDITGAVSVANSLVGTTAYDNVGMGGVTALSNGNYVVSSYTWNNGAAYSAGAVTWGNGSTGITGAVSQANSLVGTRVGDNVGSGGFEFGEGGVTALFNGNYVISSPYWNNWAATNAGAVTWGNGSTGITGAVSAANSLVGTTAYDYVGYGGVTALLNGNYVVSSYYWNNGAATDAGAVTWGNGSTGITGAVSAANSLVGTTASDNVGYGGVTALLNGNYVVSSYYWNNGAATDAGAVTWGNGSTGITGAVSVANSLVGTTANDNVGIGGITALSNGNYVVSSYNWNNGAATDAGAVTWGNGSTGTTGAVSVANSLVGTTANDNVGSSGVTALLNGNYVVRSPEWNNGVVANAAAATWVNGATGQAVNGSNIISLQNSIVGKAANAGLNAVVEDPVNGTFLAGFSGANQVSVGFVDPNPNLLTFARGQGATVTITSDFLTRTLNAGTAVVLQANNDITVNSPIIANNPGGSGGDLTLQAGRSLLVNANIITDSGNLTLTGNNPLASGVVDAFRDAGNAVISIAPGVTLDSGTGNTTIRLDTGAGLTNNASGAITLAGTINANNLTVENSGTSGGTVNIPATGIINLTGNFLQNAPSPVVLGGSLTTRGTPIQLKGAVTLTGSASLSTGAGAADIIFNNSVDGNFDLTLNSGSGNITFNGAVGSTAALGNLTANSTGTTQFNSPVTAASLTTDAGGTTVIAGDVTTSGIQLFNDAVQITGDRTFSSNNGNLTFNNTLDGTIGGENLTLNAGTGNITFNGAVGNIPLGGILLNSTGTTQFNSTVNAASLTTDTGGTTVIAGDVTTSGIQLFNDAVQITGDRTFTTNNGNITFNNPLDGTIGGENLTLNAGTGNITFNAAVGTTPLGGILLNSAGTTQINSSFNAASLTTDTGGTTVITGDVTTSGIQLFNDAVQITGDRTFSSNNGNLTFNNTLDGTIGGENLTLNAGTGNITFNGAVGTTPLAGILLNSAGTTQLNSTVNAASLTTDAGGTTVIAGDVTTSGIQLFNDAVQITGDRTFSSNNGNLTFNNPLDGTSGGENLTLNAGTGNITFNSAVGNIPLGGILLNSTGTTQLNSTVNAASLTTDAGGTTVIAGDVTTSGIQLFNDAVQITGDRTFSSNNGNFTFNNTLDGTIGGENLTLNAGTGNITFNGAVGSTAALGNLTANSTGTTQFNSTVSAASLTTSASGTTFLGGDISATSSLNFSNALTLGNDISVSSTAGNITFGSTVDGASNLTVTAGGNIIFNGAVGNLTPLASLTAITPGLITLNNNLTASNGVNFSQATGGITLGGNVAIATSGNNGTILLDGSAVNGAGFTLTLDAGSGNISLATVGDIAPLSSLTVKTTGQTTLGGDIKASIVDLQQASNISLGGNLTLDTSAENGNIILGGSIDGTNGTENLTLNAGTGNITLNGAVGSRIALGNLALNSSGTTRFNAAINAASLATDAAGNTVINGNISTAGAVNLQDAVTLTNDATITGNAIAFGSTVDGSRILTLNAGSGNVSFGGAIGNLTPLLGLAIDAQNIDAASTIAAGTSGIRMNASGTIKLNDALSVLNGTVNLTAQGDITVGDISTASSGGIGGTIALASNFGAIATGDINSSGTLGGGVLSISTPNNITTGNLDASSISGSGGAINLTSTTGAIQTENLNSSGASGGNIIFQAESAITAEKINASGSSGAGGNVTLDPLNDVIFTWINAEGATTGGNIFIQSIDGNVKATGTFTAANGSAASISAIGGNSGGSITIGHGGKGIIPFIVGDATTNGTAGAIVSLNNAIAFGEYLYTFNQGNIAIVSAPEPVPAPAPEPVPAPAPEPVPAPAPEPVPAPAPEPVPEPAPEPVPEPAPQPVPAPTPQPVPAPTPQPVPAPIQAAEPPVAEPPAQTFEPPAPPAAEPPAAVPPVAERLPSPSPLLNFVSETQSPAERELPNLASTEQILKIQSSASVLESELSNSATADASQSPTTGNRQSQSADSSSSSNEASTSLEESSGANNILKTVFKTELLRIQEFEQYLGVTTDSAESDIPKFQGNLGAIKQQTGRAYALIYVVANPDQLELIVVPPKGSPIHRTVPEAPRETLLAVAKQFRQNITDRRLQHTLQYLQPARQLYQWIISPVEKDLQDMQVDTLLFSLDAGLRTMPIAALYDGQQFLVEKYSFSLTPSFTLTDWDYQSLQNEPILAFGASEFSDQTPLPAVPVELQQVVSSRAPQSVYSPSQDSKSFLNREFTLNNLKNQRATTPFRIVHLATHADFLPGAPSNSYIQLWDRRLRLDELPQLNWNNPQVDLLVLSACRTALGDEQSEMGFAGLAVISGAKSAVASLWYVSDLGTLGLMSEFYQNLREAPIKAEALRLAQIAMIRGTLRVKNGQLIGSNGIIKLPPELAERGDIPLSHPYYWSAFTTIGSPW